MNYQDKISTIVEEALTEKTFNLEIITKIKALKDDFETVTKENEDLEKQVTFFQNANDVLSVENTQVIAENTAYKAREDALATKEKAADKQAYELEFQTKRAVEIRELFGIVFRNPTVQTSVMRNTQKPVENGSCLNYVSESETTTETIL